MQSKPIRIGITGGIGSGKTLVTKVFSLLGAPVYDADTRAKWLTNNRADVRNEIINVLGDKAYQDDKLNSSYVASLVFSDSVLLNKLNQIIHPAVAKDFEEWVVQFGNFPYIIKEAALLFEAGSHKYLDKVFVVTAPEEIRIKRVLKRDTFRTLSEVKSIMNKQLPEDEKIAMADQVIYNDESRLLLPQVVMLHQQLLS